MLKRKISQFLFIFAVIALALACRTTDTIAKLAAAPTSTHAVPTHSATHRPTRISSQIQSDATPTAIVAVTDVPEPPTNAPAPRATANTKPAATHAPTSRPVVRATNRPPNTPVPATPTSQYTYKIQESRCGPNVRTYIEGYVYEGSVGRNGVLVRISQGPDGGPDPNDDYKTGTDPKRAGYYYQNVDSNAPHDGTWYIWVIDPATQQRISEIAIVKTDKVRVEDNGNSAGSCQSATVNFSTAGPRATSRPSNTPRSTRDPNASPTPSPTQDVNNDS